MDENGKIDGNFEISRAVQEFETRAKIAEGLKAQKSNPISNLPPLIRLVIKLSGGHLSEKQAEYCLLGVAMLMLCTSLFFFFRAGPEKSKRSFDFRKIDQSQFTR